MMEAMTMAQKVKAADLRKVVDGILADYSDEVVEAADVAVKKTAEEAVSKLKNARPGFKDKKYSKGWTKKITKHRLYSEAVVYNKTQGHLTHLLEFGHALRNGGRAASFPHIAPVNDEVPDIFEDEFSVALK